MTEINIIDELSDWLDSRKYPFQLPRSFIYDWESDYWAMTKEGITREFEIKTSRSDFRKDCLKDKHRVMGVGGPNFFYYVCPEGLIKPDEIDRRYGLLYVWKTGHVEVVKRPLKLHGNTFENWKHLALKMYWKWFKLWKEKWFERKITYDEYKKAKNNINEIDNQLLDLAQGKQDNRFISSGTADLSDAESESVQ